jgi:pilus assembly protein TadC
MQFNRLNRLSKINKGALIFSFVSVLLFPKIFFISPAIYWITLRVIQSLPTRKQAQSKLSVEAELPFFGQLLAALIAAGSNLLTALEVLSPMLNSDLSRRTSRTIDLLKVGSPPANAWHEWVEDPVTRDWAGGLIRAQERGRPLANLLRVSAVSLSEQRLRRARIQVSKLGVKLSLPIGVCFLPAFIFGAIVPIVISFFSTLKFF